MKKLIFITILIFLTTSFVAATVTLRGGSDCAVWLDARKNSTSMALEHHADGFLNGYAFATMNEIWLMPNNMNPSQAYYWLDNYCRENPLNTPTQDLVKLIKDRGHFAR